jgi:hypothetical protein
MVYRYMETTNGRLERCEDDAILLTPDIAFVIERGLRSIYLYRVKPSVEGGEAYDVSDILFEIDVPARTLEDFADMPPETAAFVTWLADKVVKDRATRPDYVPFPCYA